MCGGAALPPVRKTVKEMPTPRILKDASQRVKSFQVPLALGNTFRRYYPISTVGNPIAMVPPCAVKSPIRAAGIPQISTVNDPNAITSGGPTQTHIEPTHAAGMLPISTVGPPGDAIGPPTC